MSRTAANRPTHRSGNETAVNDPVVESYIIQTLRIRGAVPLHHVVPDDTQGVVVSDLIERGILIGVGASNRFVRLTDSARAMADHLFAREREQVSPAVIDALYEDFCRLNNPFKQLVTDWQIKTIGDQTLINDHSDDAYDRAVLARLGEVHKGVQRLIKGATVHLPRYERYSHRLSGAFAKVTGGDHSFVASPAIDSYHTVWFEFHEDLIIVGGRTRADEAKAGRG